MKHLIFDSFAFMALFRNEPGGSRVLELLNELADSNNTMGWMSSINLGEVYYMMARKSNKVAAQAALGDIATLPIEIILPDLTACLRAAELKADHLISYADAFAAELTLQKNGTLITGDHEFKSLETLPEFKIEYLTK